MPILGYAEWENFRKAIGKAIESCEKAEMEPADHFRESTAMVILVVELSDKLKIGFCLATLAI